MARASNRPTLREHLVLFARFLRHPITVGAIAPSSPTLARAMVRDLHPAESPRVVEIGPGTGSFTSAILDRLGPHGRLLAIEIDPAFAKRIKQRFPGIDCVCASAERMSELAAERGLLPLDHVISGVPFASLPMPMTRAILDGLERALRPGGTFTAFQYVHSYRLPPAIAFRNELARRFGKPPERSLVLWNIPPAWVLRWTR